SRSTVADRVNGIPAPAAQPTSTESSSSSTASLAAGMVRGQMPSRASTSASGVVDVIVKPSGGWAPASPKTVKALPVPVVKRGKYLSPVNPASSAAAAQVAVSA